MAHKPKGSAVVVRRTAPNSLECLDTARWSRRLEVSAELDWSRLPFRTAAARQARDLDIGRLTHPRPDQSPAAAADGEYTDANEYLDRSIVAHRASRLGTGRSITADEKSRFPGAVNVPYP